MLMATMDQKPSSLVGIGVLDHGHVGLYRSQADDLSVVNSARISFDTRHEQIEEGDDKLINYLMKNRHGTPFEHNSFTFDVKAPIFVFREWHRHRIASINEMSARYTELPGEWYIPEPENVRTRVGKPGHYTYEPMHKEFAQHFLNRLQKTCKASYDLYRAALFDGIAPEQARLFLHVNHYSHMFWTVNARSIMNFLNLRNAPTAQWEIKQFAMVIEEFFAMKMPLTYKAFLDNERVAP
jgi:thymidylate synthase (FAD)